MKIDETIMRTTLEEAVGQQRAQELIALAQERQRQEAEANAAQESDQTRSEVRFVSFLFSPEELLEQAQLLASRCSVMTVAIEDGENHENLKERILTKASVANMGRRRANRLTKMSEALSDLSPKKHFEGFPKKILNKEHSMVIATVDEPIGTISEPQPDVPPTE